jgi:hypothetical protein
METGAWRFGVGAATRGSLWKVRERTGGRGIELEVTNLVGGQFPGFLESLGSFGVARFRLRLGLGLRIHIRVRVGVRNPVTHFALLLRCREFLLEPRNAIADVRELLARLPDGPLEAFSIRSSRLELPLRYMYAFCDCRPNSGVCEYVNM